jgi:uncharacterized lipoprotein YajG
MKDEHHNYRKKKLSFLTFLSLVLLLTGVTAQAQTQQVAEPVIESIVDVDRNNR